MAESLVMDNLYLSIFLVLFPSMSALTFLVIALIWSFSVSRRNNAKKLLNFGAAGAILGYFGAFVYFSITLGIDVSNLANRSLSGLLAGAGYMMILERILYLMKKCTHLTTQQNSENI